MCCFFVVACRRARSIMLVTGLLHPWLGLYPALQFDFALHLHSKEYNFG